MRTKFFIAIIMLTFTMSASADEDKYDIGNYLEHASRVVSPNVDYFFISKMMISMTNGDKSVLGLTLGEMRKSIDFIRSVNITSNETQQEMDLIRGAEELATRVYKQYGYKSIVVSGKAGKRFYLFGKYKDGEIQHGMSSLLLVITNREIDAATQKPVLTGANVCLMGGEFTYENLQFLLNQIQ